jgi:hypothetical protein
MLVTHSFLISDKFARAKTTSNPNKQNNNNNVEVPMVDISNINNRHSSKIGSSSSLQVNNFPHFYDQNSLAYDAVSSSGKNTATADGGATAVEGEKAAFDPEGVSQPDRPHCGRGSFPRGSAGAGLWLDTFLAKSTKENGALWLMVTSLYIYIYIFVTSYKYI